MDSVINQPVKVDQQEFLVRASMSAIRSRVSLSKNFNFDWREVGRKMEGHEKFPERANIVFVKVLDRENIELKIWERGAGETSASGTCSSGAAVLSRVSR